MQASKDRNNLCWLGGKKYQNQKNNPKAKKTCFHCVVPRTACGSQVLRGPAKFPVRLEDSTGRGDEFCLTFLVDTCVRGNSEIKAESESLQDLRLGRRRAGGGEKNTLPALPPTPPKNKKKLTAFRSLHGLFLCLVAIFFFKKPMYSFPFSP